MMIKGSFLCSVPIVKRFRAKISKYKMDQKLVVWGFGGENFNPNNETPRKSIPTETRYLAQKRCRSF